MASEQAFMHVDVLCGVKLLIAVVHCDGPPPQAMLHTSYFVIVIA